MSQSEGLYVKSVVIGLHARSQARGECWSRKDWRRGRDSNPWYIFIALPPSRRHSARQIGHAGTVAPLDPPFTALARIPAINAPLEQGRTSCARRRPGLAPPGRHWPANKWARTGNTGPDVRPQLPTEAMTIRTAPQTGAPRTRRLSGRNGRARPPSDPLRRYRVAALGVVPQR